MTPVAAVRSRPNSANILAFLLGRWHVESDRPRVKAGAAGDIPGDGAWPTLWIAPPMPANDLNDEILEAISEAAVEIANLSGPDNIVCRRLRNLQRKLAPQTATVGELARRV